MMALTFQAPSTSSRASISSPSSIPSSSGVLFFRSPTPSNVNCIDLGSRERFLQNASMSFDVDVQTISLPAEEGKVFSDKSCTLTPTPLPLLCIEDGLAILRFSEIFGADHDRLSYSAPKHRHTKSMDVSDDIVEDDEEEAFLQGFQSLTVKHGISESSFKDDDSNFTKLKDSCFVAESMKQDLTVYVSEERERQPPLVSKFFPLDQQDWEDGIVWGNSPIASDGDVESCEISGLSQQADAIPKFCA